MEREDFPAPLRHPQERLVEEILTLHGTDRARALPGHRRLVGGNEPVHPGAPPMHPGEIPGDALQPRRDLLGLSDGPEAPVGSEEDLLRQLLTVREIPGLVETDSKDEAPVLAHEVAESIPVPALRPDDEFAWLCHFASVRFLCHHQYSGAGSPKGWVGDG